MKRGLIILLCGAGIIAVFMILLRLKLPFNTLLWREIHNTGHTPLFAIMAVCVLGLISKARIIQSRQRIYRYLLALILTLGLGAAFEIYQIWGPGDADIIDFMRDVTGALPALAIVMSFDKDLIRSWKSGYKWKSRLRAGASIILILAFLPLGILSAAYLERGAIFPVILSFNSNLDLKFAQTRRARLETVEAIPQWPGPTGKVGRLTFLGGTYPGLTIRETYPDWTGYRFLKFDIFSLESDSIHLTLRIDDRHHNGAYRDRFNRSIIIRPGENEIKIPLDDIRNGPVNRKMDMKSIRNLIIFAAPNKKLFSLYFDNLRLEKN